MKEPFFILAPERVRYSRFWVEIRKRNRWLIMLRYGAVGMLCSLILGIIVLKTTFSLYNFNEILPLVIIAISILVYNLLFHYYWHYDREKRIRKYKIHGLRFSLTQICTDLLALMLFIYYTGGVESPIYVFFIFHVIIGSLFLPGRIISLIITLTLIGTCGASFLEYYNIIPHHHISGWLGLELYQNLFYIIVHFLFFGIALYLSIYLANSIARQLYRRSKDLTIAYEELENAEKTKSKYVMSVVHDLKTPIAAVATYLNMILDRTLGEVKEELLNPLERSKYRLDRAIETIDNILRISQIKLSSTPEELTDVDIGEIFRDIYKDVNVLLEAKNLEYKLIDESDDGLIIQGEPALLKLAFSNLVSNACKYTRNNGRIEVKLSFTGKNATVNIADSGIGIPDDAKDKIFQEFYRTPLSKKAGFEGTGLGMSIVKYIIEKHHGSIEVKSPSDLGDNQENPGTEFVVSIPKSWEYFQG
ncbi:MAG: HAMP domain-containing sensor histidine kinase [bacterium]